MKLIIHSVGGTQEILMLNVRYIN